MDRYARVFQYWSHNSIVIYGLADYSVDFQSGQYQRLTAAEQTTGLAGSYDCMPTQWHNAR